MEACCDLQVDVNGEGTFFVDKVRCSSSIPYSKFQFFCSVFPIFKVKFSLVSHHSQVQPCNSVTHNFSSASFFFCFSAVPNRPPLNTASIFAGSVVTDPIVFLTLSLIWSFSFTKCTLWSSLSGLYVSFPYLIHCSGYGI